MKKHFKAEVKGKVQGVGFRKATEERAKALKLDGMVKNLENGNVYVEAESPEFQVAEFIE